MEGHYPVIFDNITAGEVHVSKRGLYYFLSCKCYLPNNTAYRLYADCGSQKVQLGVLLPNKDCFTLQMHIPISKLNTDHLLFYATEKNMQKEESAVLRVDTKCICLSKLEAAYLQKNGHAYELRYHE